MGHRHTKDEILEGAVAVAAEGGLSQLSFGRVARHLAISDRIVVYYFPSKDDLIGEVLLAMGGQLQTRLAAAFVRPCADHLELARLAWPVLAAPSADRTFASFFEASGLAAAGIEPFRSLVPALVDAWVAWAAEFVTGPARHRRAEAEAAVALLDGLLLFRQIAGPTAANRAARHLGL